MCQDTRDIDLTCFQPPPANRRRIRSPPIEIRSPSPVCAPPFVESTLNLSQEVIRNSYRSPEAWAKGIEPLLATMPSLVTAPSTAAAIHALLSHFNGLFGGAPYVAEDKVDAVMIAPTGPFGLFAEEGSWKRYDVYS